MGWHAVQVTSLATAMILLWRIFARRCEVLEFLAVVLFVLALQGARENTAYAQSTFIALLLTLLVWRDKGTWRAGIWASLGLIVKPERYFADDPNTSLVLTAVLVDHSLRVIN